MPRDDSVYLRHILDAIAKIESYLQGIDYQTFSQESLIQDGVIRQTEIIGEAVWLTALEDLPVLKTQVGRILQDMDSSSGA